MGTGRESRMYQSNHQIAKVQLAYCQRSLSKIAVKDYGAGAARAMQQGTLCPGTSS